MLLLARRSNALVQEISEETRRDLQEERANEKKIEDGEFYYRIRVYQGFFGERDRHREEIWWAHLAGQSNNTDRRDRLSQLLGHSRFYPVFDSLGVIPALYSGLRLSSVNKMISDPCRDVGLSIS